MPDKIRVAMLEDHHSTMNGYQYRLEGQADIEIVASAAFGEDLETMLAEHPVDVLLLDIGVPTSPDNPAPYPILHLVPKLLSRYPRLNILVISMHNQRTLTDALMNAGVRGYMLKDDRAGAQNLANVVRTIAGEGIYMSPEAFNELRKRKTGGLNQPLSLRQLEALSLCAAYPDENSDAIARRMSIESSSLRTLLSGAYLKLDVRTRAGAVDKARKLGLISPLPDDPPAHKLDD